MGDYDYDRYGRRREYSHRADHNDYHRRRGRTPSPAPEIHIHNVQDNIDNRGPDPRGRPAYRYADDYRPPHYVPVPVPGAFPVAAMPSPTFPMIPVQGRSRSRSHSRSHSGSRRGEDVRRAAIEEYKYHQMEEDRRRQQAIRDAEMRREEEENRRKREASDAVEKWKQKEREKKEEEERLEKELELKREKKEIERKEKKAKEEKEVEERVGKALRKLDLDLDEDDVEKLAKGKHVDSHALIRHKSPAAPVWSRVKRAEISAKTLEYYDIPYGRDPHDPEWFIIKEELSQREIDLLFEHTRRHRHKDSGSGPALIETKRDGGYALVKPRSPNRERSRSRSRVRNVSGAEKLAGAVLRFM